MNKFIEIIVAPNGATKVETKGFSGSECREASRLIERALGAKSSELLTAEFYQTHSTDQVQKNNHQCGS